MGVPERPDPRGDLPQAGVLEVLPVDPFGCHIEHIRHIYKDFQQFSFSLAGCGVGCPALGGREGGTGVLGAGAAEMLGHSPHLLLEIRRGDVEHVRDVLGQLPAADLIYRVKGRAGDDNPQEILDDGPAVGQIPARGLPGCLPAEPGVLEGIGRLGYQASKRLGALGQDEIAGVLPGRDRRDADVDPLGQEHLQPAVGRLCPGRVGVENQDHLPGVAAQQPDVLLGKRRAQRGDDVGYPGLERDKRVEVSLSHHGRAGGDDALAGPVKRVKVAGLVEQDRLGAVEVLGAVVGVQSPAAKGDNLAAGVQDREHQAVAEAVVVAALVALDHQPGGGELGVAHVFASRRPQQAVPSARGVAQAEAFDGIVRKSPAAGVGQCGGAGLPAKLGAVEVRREAHHFGQVGLAHAAGPGRGLAALGRQGYVCPLSQGLDCLWERHFFVQAQELEYAAAGAAGEALEYLLCGRDVHGGLVVVVERADADVLAPAFCQRNVLADKLDDIGRLRDLLNELFRKPRHCSGFRGQGFRLQASGYRLQGTDFRLQTSGHRGKASGLFPRTRGGRERR